MAFGADEAPRDPRPDERALSDYLSPHRPGSVRTLVVTASRDVGVDVSHWPFERILGVVGQLASEARERERQQA